MRIREITLADLKPGSTIIADDGFTCMTAGQKTVHADAHGLYVPCNDGKHYLDGQEDEDGKLVGISK